MTGDIGPKSTTESPLAAILSARLAPPSAATCSVFMVKPVLFQLPTKHGSRPASGVASGAADAAAAAAGAAAAVADGVGASVAPGALLQPSTREPTIASAKTATTEPVLCMAWVVARTPI